MIARDTNNVAGDSKTLEEVKNKHYDAIIVGGGLAGLVAAARLSEDPAKQILVIEAGADRRGDFNVDCPGMLEAIWGNPEYDWDFYSEPQAALNGRQVPQPRGKLLGGSSAINAFQLVYPSQRNFDIWARIGQNDWTHDVLLPYYRKFHKFSPASKSVSDHLALDSYMDAALHGNDGPLQASYPDAYIPINQAWMEAFRTAGMNNDKDPISGGRLGAFHAPNTIDPNGSVRSYSASAYYDSKIAGRPNLDLLTETRVTKILLEKRDELVDATGVEALDKHGSVQQILAKEVIMAAGAFHTPQILELSGIGSSSILSEHGIDVVIDNPAVGENLQDHAFTTVLYEVAEGQMSGDVVRDQAVVEFLVKQYVDSKTGPLTGLPMALAYVPPVNFDGVMERSDLRNLLDSHLSEPAAPVRPGVQAQYDELRDMVLDPKQTTIYYALSPRQMHVKATGKTSLWEAYRPTLPEDYIAIMIGLNHPFSRGTVHIGSRNPLDRPIIDPKYLSHPMDLELLARGTQFVDKIAKQPAMAQLLKTDKTEPRSAAGRLSDLDTAKQITKDRLMTNFHPACTCAMLPREQGGVVSDRLVVHGTRNLRVIDASIFPMITSGNIQATVYAVAERASDLIKQDWARTATATLTATVA